MKAVRAVITVIAVGASLLMPAGPVAAQDTGTVRGAVLDELGGAIVGATVTARDAGGNIRTVTTDGNGGFVLPSTPPGKYDVRAESSLFDPAQATIVVAVDTPPQPIRLTLKISGLTDSLVVTGRRVEARRSETPQEIQLVTREDIERSVAVDLTDALKKNSGVDVIQYPGLLSGIGMRGFNPEFSGINKHSLLLIDGRPSGVTNLASLLLDNVDHIEVLRGPASSVYGASAMGGVVNVITRKSRGPLAGGVDLGLASFATSDFQGKVGGSLTTRVDFDASAHVFNQRDDYNVGSGVDQRAGYRTAPNAVYPYSAYRNNDGWLRVGADLSRTWRLDGRVNVYQARDVQNPGDVFAEGLQTSKKDFDRSTSDVRLQGQLGRHVLSTTAYSANEDSHSTRVKSTTPSEQALLPFLTSESFLSWKGLQVQDAWAWHSNNSIVIGLDSELVKSVGTRYAATGERIGPFSADSTKRTIGAYAENTLTLNKGLTVVSLGGRVDTIKTDTIDTPFKTGFVPSSTTFAVFNPSAGIKQALGAGLRAHATAGRAFVPADAAALTGFNTSIVGARTQITQGNPDLLPERSFSFDFGMERTSASHRIDVTYFQTAVSDRVVSNIVISNPAPPEPIVLSYVNALGAHMRGLDIDFDQRINRRVGLSASLTHYFEHTEDLPASGQRTINVIATNSLRAGVDLDFGPVSGRVSARYLQGRKDLDFNTAGTPQIDYEDFAVVDLSAVYHLTAQHALSVAVNNLLDRYYYEKLGFPMPGRAFMLKYRLGLDRRSATARP